MGIVLQIIGIKFHRQVFYGLVIVQNCRIPLAPIGKEPPNFKFQKRLVQQRTFAVRKFPVNDRICLSRPSNGLIVLLNVFTPIRKTAENHHGI
ncbi:MAG: hypothetical protein AAF570_20485, partial [Bacteroidota bacterium]